jgi:hypothetical protein
MKIRALYMQAKICGWLSAAFGLAGFAMFAFMYQKYIAPNPVAALRDISSLFIVLFPFLPALALSLAAKRYEKRYLAMMPKG